MSKTKHVRMPSLLRVEPDVHARLKAMAERQRRSIPNLIHVIIEEAVAADRKRYPEESHG